METDDQRRRDRDRRTPGSRLASSRSSPCSALTREDRDRGHEAVSSWQAQGSQQQKESLSRISLLLQQSSDSLTRDQRNLVDLSAAVLRQDIVRARKLAKNLEGMDMDQAWRELAQMNATKNPEAEKLAGPLHHAAQSGYKAMCKLIITQCKCDVNAGTIDGRTPLMFALNGEGNDAIVKYLISNHADPNSADNAGITPLHIAATKGYYEIAEHLLSKGANVDPICQDGESPLFCAAIQGNERIVTLLLKHNADYNRLSKKLITPLLASLHGSSLNCLEILIEAGADVNGAGCSVPPVALAAYKGLDRCIQCLLRNGANPNVPDEDNNIPVQIAAVKGWEKCVEILLPHAPHLTQYEGLSISEIVQWERTRFRRSSRAIEQGDAAYWRKERDIALRLYTEAAQVGHKDPALYAKRSLCHLYLHDPAKFIEEAINYMNMVQPNLSTVDPESDARKVLLEPGKNRGLVRGRVLEVARPTTDKTSSGEHEREVVAFAGPSTESVGLISATVRRSAQMLGVKGPDLAYYSVSGGETY